MRAAIAIRGASLDPPAALEHMQEPSKPGTLDVECLADCGLRSARIGLDQQQHGILRRANVHRRQRADEVLEDGDLQPTEKIAKVPVELAKLQPLCLLEFRR